MRIILLIFLWTSAISLAQSSDLKRYYYPNYSSWIDKIREKSKSSQLRIWIATHSLVDNEYFRLLVQLRSQQLIDVRLLTNKRYVYPPKNKDFYAGTLPKHRVFDSPTTILIDDTLYFVDIAIDPTAKGSVKEVQAPSNLLNIYERLYASYTKDVELAEDKSTKIALPNNKSDLDGAYNYDRSSSRETRAPEGVPTKLPGVLYYEKSE